MLKKKPHYILVLLFLGLLFIGYVYFFEISPTFVKKPNMERPSQIDEDLSEEEIIYVLNEMDAYKLHDNPLTSEPAIIQFDVVDGDTKIIQIKDNDFLVIESGEPDIIISGEEESLISILRSEDIEKAMIELYLSGNVGLEILADESTLALKGYKSLYDKFSSNNKITGEVIGLNPIRVEDSMNLFFLLFVSLIIGLIIEKL